MTDTGIVRLIVNSSKSLVEHDQVVYDMFGEHKHLTVTIRPGLDRSVDQNRLWWRMYKRIGETQGVDTEKARASCKWYCGIPILIEDQDGFEESFNKVFGHLSEQHCVALMGPNKLFGKNGFPVSSLFSTKQGCRYTENIEHHFIDYGVNFADILNEK